MAKTFQDITHPDDLNADLGHVQDLLAGRTDYYQMEKRYFHRASHVVHVRLTVSLVRDAAGAPVHFISQIEDISQAKQIMASLAAARDGALAASRLKSEFLANMSHEIRTPMNGVIGMADLLMDSPLTTDQRQMGRVIRSSAENLLKIINDILDFSKIEAGKLSIEPMDFSLAEQIQHTVALLMPRARARGLALTTELPPDLPPGLSGDAGRIQQVLINLIGNAVKFTEKGGVAVIVQTLPASQPGRYAFRTEVRDTGIGISPEERTRLFQPFTQADGSTTRKYGGTGLGLAISQQLIGLMDGRIGLESHVGEGSVFWFELELPVVAVEEPAAAAPRRAVCHAGGSGHLRPGGGGQHGQSARHPPASGKTRTELRDRERRHGRARATGGAGFCRRAHGLPDAAARRLRDRPAHSRAVRRRAPAPAFRSSHSPRTLSPATAKNAWQRAWTIISPNRSGSTPCNRPSGAWG